MEHGDTGLDEIANASSSRLDDPDQCLDKVAVEFSPASTAVPPGDEDQIEEPRTATSCVMGPQQFSHMTTEKSSAFTKRVIFATMAVAWCFPIPVATAVYQLFKNGPGVPATVVALAHYIRREPEETIKHTLTSLMPFEKLVNKFGFAAGLLCWCFPLPLVAALMQLARKLSRRGSGLALAVTLAACDSHRQVASAPRYERQI